MDMKKWLQDMREAPVKKALPVLSFPAIQLMGISVRDLIASSDAQAKGMKMVADRVDSAASVSLMDLSVEAECFGSAIRFSDDEVPTVVGSIVSSEEEAKALEIPPSAPAAPAFTSRRSKRPQSSSPIARFSRASSAPSHWRGA